MSNANHMANETDHAVATSSTRVRYVIHSLYLTAAVFFTLLFFTNARADYQPLAVTDLFGGSDLIVLGVIESVDEINFTLRETEIFTGSVANAPLVVKKYRDWPGGRRWDTYRAGQTVLLFLRRPAEDENIAGEFWRIRGVGGEGEMPIEDGAVFAHGVNLEGFQRQKHKVDGSELYSYRFDMSKFTSALKGYLRCYGSPQTITTKDIKEPARQCSESELLSYRITSRLHCYLAKSKPRKTE